MSTDALAPGLMVIHGNHPEALRDLLVAWMKRHPLAPLENELVLVQSNGIAQWLKLALAADATDGGAGGCGIAAALEALLPARFVWQAYRAVLGADAVPEVSPFDESRLVWRLVRLLPTLAAEPVYAPLARFLDGDADLRKRHQLAERLADVFDQYQMYRADWLAAWARGEDVLIDARGARTPLPAAQRWQPALWRALIADVGAALADSGRAAVHTRFLAAMQAASDARPAGLPRRVMVFGVSSLPAQALEVLAAIARWSQVLMCVHNPCEHYWADIVADQALLRATHRRQARKPGMPAVLADDALHLHAHPLLAAWGRQGRDFIALLDEHDAADAPARYGARFAEIRQRIDLFAPHGEDTLLHQLQDDIRDLRPLTDTRARWPAVDPARDASIRFHVAHGPQREVEILHDQLLAAFDADATLRPRDVIVMVPDIDAYAPHIDAVFGLIDAQDPRHIPFTVADRGLRHRDPLVNALERLLELPQSRIAVSDVLDLLEVPALRARFGITAAELPLLHRWIAGANIRWGLDAAHRASLELPHASAQNTWAFGLRRMLLGYAAGAEAAGWQGIEPFDEVGGLEAAALGPLVALVARLEASWQTLREAADAQTWCLRLRALVADFFAPVDSGEAYTLQRLDAALQDWQQACAAAALTEPLPLAVVREHWLGALDVPQLTQRFFAGAVTFATLMPMRAIPFRHVHLLGMNDGAYPRTRVPVDFDLMGGDYRPGDRSRREDDRYLFLEALLSARERFTVSWVGRSIHDNTERPPSVLVGQLRDHLAAGWRLAGHAGDGAAAGRALVSALTVVHPLQPFSRVYFAPSDAQTPLFTYAREWRDGVLAAQRGAEAARRQVHDAAGGAKGRAGAVPAGVSADAAAHLPPFERDGALTLSELGGFLKDPARAFLRGRLGVYFEQPDPLGEDHEPFALDALQQWQLQDELIRAQRDALARGRPREAALADALERIGRRGELAAGPFAEPWRAALAEPMDDLFARYARALADWPRADDDEDVAVCIGADGAWMPVTDAADGGRAVTADAITVVDRIAELRRNADGARARVALDSSRLVKERRYRRDKLVGHWVLHLAGHLAGVPLTSVIVGKAGTVTLPPLAVEAARAHFADLVAAWHAGLQRPLPWAARSAFAWLEKGGTPQAGCDGDAARAARSAYEGGFKTRGERDDSPYLLRAWPDFDALWAGGEFAQWTERLLRPLYDAVEAGKPGAKEAA